MLGQPCEELAFSELLPTTQLRAPSEALWVWGLGFKGLGLRVYAAAPFAFKLDVQRGWNQGIGSAVYAAQLQGVEGFRVHGLRVISGNRSQQSSCRGLEPLPVLAGRCFPGQYFQLPATYMPQLWGNRYRGRSSWLSIHNLRKLDPDCTSISGAPFTGLICCSSSH